MAAEVVAIVPRSESYALLAQEERLRGYLDSRLRVRTRFAPLGSARALLVNPATAGRPSGLVVDAQATIAERIYLYVHVAAHIALGHHLPLVTIVEGDGSPDDEAAHARAEELARELWWGESEIARSLAAGRAGRSPLLRRLLRGGATRGVLRRTLLAMRRTYYGLRLDAILERSSLTAWLRQALCVTAVVSAAPQLAANGGRGGAR